MMVSDSKGRRGFTFIKAFHEHAFFKVRFPLLHHIIIVGHLKRGNYDFIT
jgi:hypothetical protein